MIMRQTLQIMKIGLIKRKKAQSVLEYAIIIAAVSAALIAMRPYAQRAVQAVLKDIDQRFTQKAE